MEILSSLMISYTVDLGASLIQVSVSDGRSIARQEDAQISYSRRHTASSLGTDTKLSDMTNMHLHPYPCREVGRSFAVPHYFCSSFGWASDKLLPTRAIPKNSTEVFGPKT